MKVIINCIEKDSKGVIDKIGSSISPSPLTKDSFIKTIRNAEKNSQKVDIETSKGTKVEIIKDKYLRTDGDKTKDDDLLNMPICGYGNN